MNGSSRIDLRSVVFDCPDPVALATFYADLTGGHRVDTDPDWQEVHRDDLPVKLAFQRVPQYVRPQWPDGVPQQVHLDLTVSDLDASCLWAASLGASALTGRTVEPGCVFVVFADPAGHPFCLCQER